MYMQSQCTVCLVVRLVGGMQREHYPVNLHEVRVLLVPPHVHHPLVGGLALPLVLRYPPLPQQECWPIRKYTL